jgi:hypothetical protein
MSQPNPQQEIEVVCEQALEEYKQRVIKIIEEMKEKIYNNPDFYTKTGEGQYQLLVGLIKTLKEGV